MGLSKRNLEHTITALCVVLYGCFWFQNQIEKHEDILKYLKSTHALPHKIVGQVSGQHVRTESRFHRARVDLQHEEKRQTCGISSTFQDSNFEQKFPSHLESRHNSSCHLQHSVDGVIAVKHGLLILLNTESVAKNPLE